MSVDVDRILERGSLEDIESLLNAAESGEDEASILAKLDTGDTEPAKPAEPAGEAPPQEQEQQEPEKPKVLRAKDGVHEIPFKVLEDERAEKAALKQQLDALTRQNELLSGQLTAANITPKQLPEQIRFTPEQLSELASYGEIGEAVAILAQQNALLLEQVNGRAAPPQQETPQPQEQQGDAPPPVIAANPDLARWWNSQDKWGIAEAVDASLQADPKWAGKPLQERIPEIVRRTKAAIGESSAQDIDQRAADALRNAAPRVPNSLTDVGGELPGATKPIAEQLEDADMADVQAFLERQMKAGRPIDEVLAAVL